MRVRAPATSANMGPGLDALGVAVALPFYFAVGGDLEDMLTARVGHPAVTAYRMAGGRAEETELFWRSPIPPGRGLGFSGAARVAGAYAGLREVGRPVGEAVDGAFRIATELEGHPDNAAPSAYGGVCVAVGHDVVTLAGALSGLRICAWSPDRGTRTRESRQALGDTVDLNDAVFNIGRAALLVAALAEGRHDVLREATRDRLHQPSRLAARPDSAEALRCLLDDDRVVAAWLSGSGPSVAALVPADFDPATLTVAEGRVRVLEIERDGVSET